MTKRKGTKTTKAAPAKVRVLVLGSVGNASRSVRDSGAATLDMPATAGDAAVAAVDKVDAVLLTGGGDVTPSLYGATPNRNNYGHNEQRDLTEVLVIEAAAKRGIPILGICRGHQMLNVAFGGTLHQHLPDTDFAHAFHGGGHDHRVRAAEGSRLADAWSDQEDLTAWVTSIHHQAVDQVADGFVATGWGLDGTIEAIEAVDGFMMGVQFHPEMRWDSWSQSIFDRFIRAAATNAKKPLPRGTTVAQRARQYAVKEPKKAPATDRPGYTSPYATKAQKAKERPARVRVATNHTGGNVVTRYRCFRCGVPDFDERVDYVDHMMLLHGVDLEMLDMVAR